MGSTKRNLKQYQVITNGDMSQSSLTSQVTNINQLDNVAYQLNWSGSPVGSFQVQVSIDYNQDEFGNVTNAGHWTPLALSGGASTSGGSPIFINVSQIGAPWIRVVYTRTSGSGTLQAWVAAKMI